MNLLNNPTPPSYKLTLPASQGGNQATYLRRSQSLLAGRCWRLSSLFNPLSAYIGSPSKKAVAE